MNHLPPQACWRLTGMLIITLHASPVMAQGESRASADNRSPAAVETLREFAEQRRPRLLFPNEQSMFHGARHGFVNTGTGNLTFVHRDLILAGSLPVQIARTYDSQSGWRLSLAETLHPQGDGWFSYTNAAGVVVSIRPARAGLRFREPQPSPIARFDTDGSSFAVLHFNDGVVRRFKWIGGVFRQQSVSDRNGNRFDLAYESGHVVRVAASNGRSIAIERNGNGQMLSATDEQGRRVSFDYDDLGRLRAVRDLAGEKWSYQYGSNGRLVRMTDPLGAVLLAVAYDEHGRVSRLERDERVTRFRYKAETTQVQDDGGAETRYVHHADGAVAAVRNAAGVLSQIRRNANRQPTAILRNGDILYSFDYAADGKLVTMTGYSPSAPEHRVFDYDADGRVSSITGNGGVRLFGYDALGNPTALRQDDYWANFQWDSRGALRLWQSQGAQDYRFASNRDGRFVMVEDGIGQTTHFYYRNDGKLKALLLSNGARHEYDYNAAGLRSAIRRWDGSAVHYEHDAAGRLVLVTVVENDGQRHRLQIGFGTRALVSDISVAGAGINVLHDAAGNPAELRLAMSDSRTKHLATYAYDALNRLIQVEIEGRQPTSVSYAAGDSDIVTASDKVTGVARHAWSGGNFGARFGAAGFSVYGAVELDPSSREFRPLNGEGVAVPFDRVIQALTEMRILGLGGADAAAVDHFEAASNRMFTPPEFLSVNCCGFPCEELGGIHCRITCFPPPADDPPPPPFVQLVLQDVQVTNSGSVLIEMRVVGGILSQVDTFGPGFDGGLENVTGPFTLIADPHNVPENQTGAFVVRGSNGQSYQVTTSRERLASINDSIVLGVITVGSVAVPVIFNQHAQDAVQRLAVTSAAGEGEILLAGESFLTLSNIMRPPLPSRYAQWNAEHAYWAPGAGQHNLVNMTPWTSPGPGLVPGDGFSALRRSLASRIYQSGQPLKGVFTTRYIAMETSAGPAAVLGLTGNTTEVQIN